MKRILGTTAAALLLAGASLWGTNAAAVANVAITKHNLSVNGPGTIKATSVSETQTCVFCHIPHKASNVGPLWNRANPAATPAYTTYTSSTTKASIGQPNGSSLLCLGCHDGTIALGDLLSRTARVVIANTNAAGQMGSVLTYTVGRDLGDDHPISFVYNAALVTARGELASPAAAGGHFIVGSSAVRLDGTSQMQCSSCHDPHDNTNGKMLVMNNTNSALCITCHVKTGWATSDHSNHTNTYTGTNTSFNGTTYATPWPHTSGTTVAANGCENCHKPHTAGGRARLMNVAKEEDNCMVCHNGTAMNPALKNLVPEFSKASAHTVGTMSLTGTHDPAEAVAVTTKHVECVDCHNPHQAYGPASTNAAGTEGTLATPLAGVRGVSIANAEVKPATHEYEICFRCHADTANSLFTPGPVGMPRVTRVIVQGNTRLEFQTNNPSFHPVAGARNTTSGSLIAPWTSASTMKCTHCHNNDAAATVGTGTGPNGPHGSTNTPLLAKPYAYIDDTGANRTRSTAQATADYALCFTCHSSATILADNGAFNKHWTHISRGAGCGTCHDPHGISSTQGTALSNARLMNFATKTSTGANLVTQSGTQAIRWERVGTTQGRCYLTCHGQNHNPWTY